MSDRTQFPRDFPRAVAAVDQVLAENEDNKRGIWRQQPWLYHQMHASEHEIAAINAPVGSARARQELAQAATRLLMALEQCPEKETV